MATPEASPPYRDAILFFGILPYSYTFLTLQYALTIFINMVLDRTLFSAINGIVGEKFGSFFQILSVVVPLFSIKMTTWIHDPSNLPGTKFASRLSAANDLYVREINNLWSIMRLWESQTCEKKDSSGGSKDRMIRLSDFLNAMESPDLMSKLFELRGLS